jgi:hypothetical protein
MHVCGWVWWSAARVACLGRRVALLKDPGGPPDRPETRTVHLPGPRLVVKDKVQHAAPQQRRRDDAGLLLDLGDGRWGGGWGCGGWQSLTKTVAPGRGSDVCCARCPGSNPRDLYQDLYTKLPPCGPLTSRAAAASIVSPGSTLPPNPLTYPSPKPRFLRPSRTRRPWRTTASWGRRRTLI